MTAGKGRGQSPESRVQNPELTERTKAERPVELEQRLRGWHTLVVRVKYDRNRINRPNGLRKGAMHEVTHTRLLYLVRSRWHAAEDFEVVGRK